MNSDNNKKSNSGGFMGAIPRKKLPPIPGSGSGSAGGGPQPAFASRNSSDGGGRDRDRGGNSSKGGGGGHHSQHSSHHHYHHNHRSSNHSNHYHDPPGYHPVLDDPGRGRIPKKKRGSLSSHESQPTMPLASSLAHRSSSGALGLSNSSITGSQKQLYQQQQQQKYHPSSSSHHHHQQGGGNRIQHFQQQQQQQHSQGGGAPRGGPGNDANSGNSHNHHHHSSYNGSVKSNNNSFGEQRTTTSYSGSAVGASVDSSSSAYVHPHHIKMVSEDPLVLRINTRDVPMMMKQQQKNHPNPLDDSYTTIAASTATPLTTSIVATTAANANATFQTNNNNDDTNQEEDNSSFGAAGSSSRQSRAPHMRGPKRKRPMYQEVDENDDLLLTDSDDDGDTNSNTNNNNNRIKKFKKKGRLAHYDPSAASGASSAAAAADSATVLQQLLPTDSGAATGGATMTGDAGIGEHATVVAPSADLAVTSSTSIGGAAAMMGGVGSAALVVVNPADTSPPPGILNSLWYSGEAFLHIFVLEKICAWKTRWSFQLVNDIGEIVTLETADATALQAKIITDKKFWSDPLKRTEVSRILPAKCPVILALAAAREAAAVQTTSKQGGDGDDAPIANAAAVKKPIYRLQAFQKEDVLLVKWRGRSFLHCSWERASDLQRLDPSTTQTARNKIKRYYQTQEQQHGPEWRKILEEERAAAPPLHGGGPPPPGSSGPAADGSTPPEEGEEDFFSPQCLEVERILACDENEMNPMVLANQRALNMKEELEDIMLKEREEEQQGDGMVNHAVAAAAVDTDGDVVMCTSRKEEDTSNSSETEKAVSALMKIIEGLVDSSQKESPWDPEDNVRYVVKWRGLPYAEMTWEYWRDIKRDAVDEAEDFWHRQKPPPEGIEEAIKVMKKPHPHIRDFKKLQESPSYGISKRERPVADLDSEHGVVLSSTSVVSGGEDEDTGPGFKLRAYQLEGVNWLLFNWWNRRSCILADEMGLGKTIQSAAFLRELQTQPSAQVRGPFLIVAPLSLIGQWQSELKSWAPDMNAVLYHGSADARDFLVQNEFYYNEPYVSKPTAIKLRKNHITKFSVLITTYEVVLKDINVLSKIRWRTLIVDEAHRLKNPKARLFEELASVPRDYCVLLTGTPIANATEELWALLHFSNPSIFKEKDEFIEKFGEMKDADQVNELHGILKPYLLRRVKEDVEKSLPPKEETILEVSLTPIQKKYYKAIYERNTAYLFKGAKPSNAPSLMNVMMELRKCCNHPYLVKGAEERILTEAAAKLKDKKDEDGNTLPIDQYRLFADQLVKSSGKMVLMEKLLQKLFADGHKVLIFSQMVRVLDLLEELLKVKKYRYERLDGSTSSSSRVHAVDRFKRKSLNRFVMLLSTRAGGLGLNLTTADVVVIFDSDWNPQNDLQAMARAHRIGQTKAVQVFRLLTAKTYEMHLFHTASLKLGLERAVLSQNREHGDDSDDNKKKKKSDKEAQAKEIDELLKKGAYDVFRDDDDKDAEKFMETDIDQLLAQSSKKVTYGNNSTEALGKGLGSFSKASFVANTDDGEKDVDLDDPDFWSKAVGFEAPEETPEDVLAMIDDGIKRSRKQVQVYDPYADVAAAEQRRRDQLALEKMLEKEEKEKQRLEKRMRKKELKEKKRKERKELRQEQLREKKKKEDEVAAVKAAAAAEAAAKAISVQKKEKDVEMKIVEKKAEKVVTAETIDKTLKDAKPPLLKEIKPKKSKKSDRQRALKRAENEDPVLERLKQAWEVPQRSKATAATIRFGFNRFCKIRNESNLTSLPLQDLESFVRSYIYQLSLQVAVILLKKLRDNPEANDLRPLFQEWLGPGSPMELNWVCDAIKSVMQMHLKVESRRRFLRMPLILAEPAYVEVLRQGAAFRALRRIGVLVRLNRLIEDCVDSILGSLGHEELGKRGCLTNEISTLDVDLKARYITTEELLLAISSKFRSLRLREPSSWWDRSCDVGLVMGTFVHGLGNYHAMRNDPDLPFMTKLRRVAEEDEPCKDATERFLIAAHAVRKVFDDALESARIKAELEVQAAVAAAAKAASKREEDAALLRRGGAEAEAVASSMPDTQVENAFEFDGTDSHFVTLPRMHNYVTEAVRKAKLGATVFGSSGHGPNEPAFPEHIKSEEYADDHDDGGTGRIRAHQKLPMPDARVLDHRLLMVLKEIETFAYPDELPCSEDPNPDLWRKTDDVLTNIQVRRAVLSQYLANVEDRIDEYSGVGLGGNQCGTSHRTLNDGSDFGFGSATNQLAQVYIGTDAPRYLRAIGVPMNITRFAVSGLVYSEISWVQQLLVTERLRFYGDEESLRKLSAGGYKDVVPDKSKDMRLPEGNSNEKDTVIKVEELVDYDHYRLDKEPGAFRRLAPVDPVDRISDVYRENAQLRAQICVAVLIYGYPASKSPGRVQQDLWRAYRRHGGTGETSPPMRLFNDEKFRKVVVSMGPDVDVPDAASIRYYVETHLMPLCCRLCINGNGPSTRGARGSQGEYETAFGVSLHPEPSENHPSPLPDPCLHTQEHSLEGLGQAHAMLRRVRLIRAVHYVCTNVSYMTIETVARSKYMEVPSDMPVWWCPWVHDVALLVHAAVKGLFSIIRDRLKHPVFSPAAVFECMKASVSQGSFPMVKRAPPEQANLWMKRQSEDFPSLFQLERRLAFLCSHLTAEIDSEARYENIPMWDHGGWPRN